MAVAVSGAAAAESLRGCHRGAAVYAGGTLRRHDAPGCNGAITPLQPRYEPHRRKAVPAACMTVAAGPTFPESVGWAVFMSQVPADRTTKRYMSTAASAKVALVKGSAGTRVVGSGRQPDSALAEFEQLYRDNADVVMAYYARRSAEPQAVADLTSETFVRAAGCSQASIHGSDATCAAVRDRVGVYARHCSQAANNRAAVARLAGHRALEGDEIEELAGKIDAERTGRELIQRCSRLPEPERAAIELVDLAGLSPKETAAVLGVSRVVLRKRLSRARGRLRKEHRSDG